ncbi:hypothetical protein BJ085DRAFT_31757 [Dimargaris cristalligena]|uniref:Uncharacterized protein n=1 Tax=Dimargaris cristalligena TaxID=215637 RepID=A0A4P9ZPL3_9FUNG|nr:hypothetical protein BJ085DRAFT_31757 [Dimargaris cristalligena]|eukprot:RKP35293.1 hypothetical protein BJ085DRAFT_31757 [Dimargaris cristalligena]
MVPQYIVGSAVGIWCISQVLAAFNPTALPDLPQTYSSKLTRGIHTGLLAVGILDTATQWQEDAQSIVNSFPAEVSFTMAHNFQDEVEMANYQADNPEALHWSPRFDPGLKLSLHGRIGAELTRLAEQRKFRVYQSLSTEQKIRVFPAGIKDIPHLEKVFSGALTVDLEQAMVHTLPRLYNHLTLWTDFRFPYLPGFEIILKHLIIPARIVALVDASRFNDLSLLLRTLPAPASYSVQASNLAFMLTVEKMGQGKFEQVTKEYDWNLRTQDPFNRHERSYLRSCAHSLGLTKLVGYLGQMWPSSPPQEPPTALYCITQFYDTRFVRFSYERGFEINLDDTLLA